MAKLKGGPLLNAIAAMHAKDKEKSPSDVAVDKQASDAPPNPSAEVQESTQGPPDSGMRPVKKNPPSGKPKMGMKQ